MAAGLSMTSSEKSIEDLYEQKRTIIILKRVYQIEHDRPSWPIYH